MLVGWSFHSMLPCSVVRLSWCTASSVAMSPTILVSYEGGGAGPGREIEKTWVSSALPSPAPQQLSPRCTIMQQ